MPGECRYVGAGISSSVRRATRSTSHLPPARHATSFLALSQIYFLGSFLESFPECTLEYFLEYFPECTLEYFLECFLELYFLENKLENFLEFFLKLCEVGSRDAAVQGGPRFEPKHPGDLDGAAGDAAVLGRERGQRRCAAPAVMARVRLKNNG